MIPGRSVFISLCALAVSKMYRAKVSKYTFQTRQR